MVRPLHPQDLIKYLVDVPTEATEYETFTYRHGKHTLTIREPLWKEYAIAVQLLDSADENPFLPFMALLPMLLIEYNGVPAIDIAQIGNLPKQIFNPLMEQMTSFFRDIGGGAEGDGSAASSLGLPTQQPELQQLTSVPEQAVKRTLKARKSSQRSAG